MALYVRQDEERSELQQRIAADLREKQKKNSLDEGSDKGERSEFNGEDAVFLEGTKPTTGLAFVWLLVFVAIMIAIGLFLAFAKG